MSSENQEVLKTLDSDQSYTFVELTFDEEFAEPPSVIITPYFDKHDIKYPFKRVRHQFNDTYFYLEKKSFASVEYITEKKALIKVGMIDTIGLGISSDESAKLFEALPFSFLIVGPLYRNFVNATDDDSEDDSYLCTQQPSSTSATTSFGNGEVSSSYESKKKERAPAPDSPPSYLRGLRA